MMELDTQDRARLVVDSLNRIIGSFHAARCTYALWIREANNPKHKMAAKYGNQIAFGVIILMLRKFKCLWKNHAQSLVGEDSDAGKQARFICDEYISRKLGPTVNQLFAHYAGDEEDLPLSTAKIAELIRSNQWDTEEEALAWSGPILSQLILIRDDINYHYKVTLSEEEIFE